MKKTPKEQKAVKTRNVTYHIFEVDDDGRLREPRGGRGYGREDYTFNRYGYDTPQEAEQAIENETGHGGYFIVPKVNIYTEYL